MPKGETKKKRFEKAFIENKDSLYRIALRITQNSSDAQDLLQEACLKSFEAFDQLKSEHLVRSWMMKILINTYREKVRKRKIDVAHEIEEAIEETLATIPDISITPDKKLIEMETIAKIKAAIEELPLDYRIAVTLAYVEGYTYEEIAKTMDCPIGTVMMRLYRGRRILRAKLASYESGLTAPEDRSKDKSHNNKLIEIALYRGKKNRGNGEEGLKT